MVEAYGLIAAYIWLRENLPFFLIVLHGQDKIINCSMALEIKGCCFRSRGRSVLAQSYFSTGTESGGIVANLERTRYFEEFFDH